MKARKLLALLLAVLMTVSAMVFPAVAVEETEQALLVYRFTSLTDSEKVYYDASLLVGSEQTNTIGRFADNTRFYGYAFPVKSGEVPTAVEFCAQLSGDLLVQVSADKTNWVTAYQAPSRVSASWQEIDMTSAARTVLSGSTTSALYVRFGDSDGSAGNGYGTCLQNSHEASMTIDYSAGTTSQGKTVSYGFSSTGLVEEKYLDPTIGVGTVNPDHVNNSEVYGRYKDVDGYYGYAFPLKESSTMPEAVTFSAMMRGDLLLEVSTDKSNWTVAYTKPESEPQNANRAWREIDLTAAVQASWGGSAPSYLYLRCGDLTKDGWGTNILASHEAVLTIDYPADSVLYSKNVAEYVFTPGKTDETQYLHTLMSNNGNLNNTGTVRFADQNNFFVYAYELYTTETPAEMTWNATTSNQLHLQLSVDTLHWVDVYKFEGELAADGSGGLPTAARSYDLMAAYTQALALAEAESSMLYLKIGDSYPSGGWGGAVSTSAPVTLRIGYASVADDLTMIQYQSTVNGTDDDKYYLSGGNVSGTARYADQLAKVVFQYPVTGAASSERVLLTMSPTAQFHLEVSVDGANWVTAFRYNDLGLMAKQSEAENQSQYFFARRERTFDLTLALKEAAALSAQQGTQDSGLYFRFGDSHPHWITADGSTDTQRGSGWGGNVTGKITLSIAQSTSLGAVADSSSVTLTQVLPNTDGTYSLIGTEPMLVTDAGISTGHLSTNINATTVTANGDGTFTTTGDGNYGGRNADNGYFVYRYQIPTSAQAMVWSAKLGGAYGVDLAIGDATCPNPNDADLWTNVALYSDDGLNGTSQSLSKIITYDLSGVDVTGGDRYVYLKIRDADLNTDGWGGRVALGSKHFVTMSWKVSLEDDVKTAGLAGVAFNVTDSINMIFYPTLPLSTTEAKAEAVYGANEIVEMVALADGSYLLDGIDPADLGTPFTFRLTGKAGDTAEFTYEKEISPKQVALDAIALYQGNAELVTMLEDMLLYGAALSVAQGGENWLSDTDITPREFGRYMISGVYSQMTYGEKQGEAEFVGSSCEGDGAHHYMAASFTATDTTDLQIRVTTHTGDVTYYGADDFVLIGEDQWMLPLPLGLYDLAKMKTLCFVENGVELTDYYMPLSCNNALAQLLDDPMIESQLEMYDMLVSFYQFGESVSAYAEATFK